MLETCEKIQSDDKTMKRQRAFSDEELMFVPSSSTAPFTRDLAFSTSVPLNDSSAQPNSTLLLCLDPTVIEPELISFLTNCLPTDEYTLYSRMLPCACIFWANSYYERCLYVEECGPLVHTLRSCSSTYSCCSWFRGHICILQWAIKFW